MQEYVVGLLYRHPSTVTLKKKLIKSYINQSILSQAVIVCYLHTWMVACQGEVLEHDGAGVQNDHLRGHRLSSALFIKLLHNLFKVDILSFFGHCSSCFLKNH
jgi:hypothetical protein